MNIDSRVNSACYARILEHLCPDDGIVVTRDNGTGSRDDPTNSGLVAILLSVRECRHGALLQANLLGATTSSAL